MAIEKFWQAVGPVSIVAPGTTRGVLTLTSTLGFHTKMVVVLTDPSLTPAQFEIKRVNPTSIEVGPCKTPITDRSDVSAYGTTSFVLATLQTRNDIPLKEIDRAVYEEEPAMAIRVISVDPTGRALGTVATFAPASFDDVKINRDACGKPLTYQFYLATVLQGTVTVTYDSNDCPIEYKRT